MKAIRMLECCLEFRATTLISQSQHVILKYSTTVSIYFGSSSPIPRQLNPYTTGNYRMLSIVLRTGGLIWYGAESNSQNNVIKLLDDTG